MIEFETIKFSTGNEIKVLRKGLSEGKKILEAEGYSQCLSNYFMQKGNSLAEYRKSMRYWIFGENK